MRKFPALEAVKDELSASGVPYEVEIGKHFRITWQANGRQRLTVVARTGSDHRGPINAKHVVRRLLREDGLIETKRSKQ